MQDIFKLVNCVVEQEFAKEKVGGRRRAVDHGPCIIIDDDDDDDNVAVGANKEGAPPSSTSGASGVQNGEPGSLQQQAVIGRAWLPVTTGNGTRYNSVSHGSQTLEPPSPLISGRTQTNGHNSTNGEGLCNGSKSLEPPPPLINGTKQTKGQNFLNGGGCVISEKVCNSNANGSVAFGLEYALWGSEEANPWSSRHAAAAAGLVRDYRCSNISSRTPHNGSSPREWRRSFLLDALALKLHNKQCRIYQPFFVFKICFLRDQRSILYLHRVKGSKE